MAILTSLISYMDQIFRGEDSLNQTCSVSIVTYLTVEADGSSCDRNKQKFFIW